MWKTWLDHSLKNTVPEHPFTVNMLKSPKLLSNLHESTSIIFFHHSSPWFGKYLPSWYVKSYGCFVTHWLPMTIILFKIVRICRPRFKCKYLENQQFFNNFLLHLWNLHQILNILKKKTILIATLFGKLQNVKDLVRPLSKKHPSSSPIDSQHVKDFHSLPKLAWKHFPHIFSSLWEILI